MRLNLVPCIRNQNHEVSGRHSSITPGWSLWRKRLSGGVAALNHRLFSVTPARIGTVESVGVRADRLPTCKCTPFPAVRLAEYVLTTFQCYHATPMCMVNSPVFRTLLFRTSLS